MRAPVFTALLTGTASLAGCRTTNTLFPVTTPEEATQEYVLDLPGRYEVRSVDFEASTDSSGVKGRGFVKVPAVDRAPVAIIRFE